MTQPRSSLVNKHTAFFLYQGKKIIFNFYAKQQAGTLVDTALFLGTGQVGRVPRWVAANVPAGVVVIEGLPHWESEPDGSDLVVFSQLYIQSAYEAVLKTFKISAMHIIGSSQAAPGVIWLANNTEQIKNVALVLPMGLNTAHFGSGGEARFKELRKRALLTVLQKDQSVLGDIRNVYISLNLIRIILAGISDGSTVNKYTVGISQDMTETMRQLTAKQKHLRRKLRVYVGEQDKVFPPNEIQQTLNEAGIQDVAIITVPDISHGSLATRKHGSFLAGVIKDIRGQ